MRPVRAETVHVNSWTRQSWNSLSEILRTNLKSPSETELKLPRTTCYWKRGSYILHGRPPLDAYPSRGCRVHNLLFCIATHWTGFTCWSSVNNDHPSTNENQAPILHSTCCYIGGWTLVPSAKSSGDWSNVPRRVDITLSRSGLALRSMRHFAALCRRGLRGVAPLATRQHETSYWRFQSFVPRVAYGLPRYYTVQGNPNVLWKRTDIIIMVTSEDLSLPVTGRSQDAGSTFSRNVRTNQRHVMRRLTTGKRSEKCVVVRTS
jgi:hypothetical protein